LALPAPAPGRGLLLVLRLDMRPQKITFGEIRDMGVRGVLVY
jgi:hypothetical protein